MRIKLGIPLTLGEIAKATGAHLNGDENEVITHLSTDTRELSLGDLFIAIKGEHFDGNSFARDAANKGALVMSSSEQSTIKSSDGKALLLSLCPYYLSKLTRLKHRIAISGSVGKTTTKEMLKVILSGGYATWASKGNFNNEIGMPLTVLSAPPECEIIICEMGMNHRGEISQMSRALRPDVSIITNIGRAHIGNLGTIEEIARAKLEICDGMSGGITIVPFGEKLLSSVIGKTEFSISEKGANFYLEHTPYGSFDFYVNTQKFSSFNLPLPEPHLQKCLSAALSAASYICTDKALLKTGVSKISRENLRQRVQRREKYYFYTDFYNASPESIYAAADALCRMSGYTNYSLLLGDVLELGDMSKDIHREIGIRLSSYPITNVFLIGTEVRELLWGLTNSGFPPERIFINTDISRPDITAEQIRSNSERDEIILMKASREIRLERVLACFKESG